MNRKEWTIKEQVLLYVRESKESGTTTPEFLAAFPDLLPQSVYPCFTNLCKDGCILAGIGFRKSKENRRSIVWVDQRYGGKVPVWGSSRPTYSYRGRTKIVLDLFHKFGSMTVPQLLAQAAVFSPGDQPLKPMSTSSLVSQLVVQKWVHKTDRKLPNRKGRHCRVYDLTPRGRQIIEAPKRKETTNDD